jgi:hypothetical protein
MPTAEYYINRSPTTAQVSDRIALLADKVIGDLLSGVAALGIGYLAQPAPAECEGRHDS